MNTVMRCARSAGVAFGLVVAAATCDFSTNIRTNLTSIYLTDAPFPYIWIQRVDLHIVSVAVSTNPDTSASGAFVTVATPNRRINLLSLTDGVALLIGGEVVPPGAVTAVRMTIDTDSSSMETVNGFVINGTSNPSIQWQASAGRPVLHALIHEQITVPQAGATIVIDFDVGRAFIPNRLLNPGSPDSGFVFSPVFRAADVARTGEIRGMVRATSESGEPVSRASLTLYLGDPTQPENTWSELGTSRSNELGGFAFGFVTRSAYWEGIPAHAGKSYIVVADLNPASPDGRALVTNVSVTAGATTNIGTVVLP